MSDTVVKFTPSVKFTEIYNTLRKIDMSDRMQTKQGLNYVPWAAALDEVCKLYEVDYEFVKFDNSEFYKRQEELSGTPNEVIGGKQDPYLITHAGLMVETKVTIEGHTRSMQLPVMNYSNLNMALTPRDINTGKKVVHVEPATMNEINKAQMRCLTKNIAAFGLAINLWTKEDVLDAVASQQKAALEARALIKAKTESAIKNDDEATKLKIAELCKTILPEECNGDPNLCEDEDTINKLIKRLKAVRSMPKKNKE